MANEHTAASQWHGVMRYGQRVDDQMERLVDVMESIAHCCGYDETTTSDGEQKQKKRKIYEGTLEKAKEYCRLYKDFNLTNDSGLDQAVTQLELALRGVDAETLRDSDAVRSQVKDEMDDILSKFAPRNNI